MPDQKHSFDKGLFLWALFLSLASDRVCPAIFRCRRCGGLLPRLFIRSRGILGWFVFCDTFRRVTPPGRYPVSCSCEARTFLQYNKVSAIIRPSDPISIDEIVFNVNQDDCKIC